MPGPDVTICIPAYKAEPFIARTLQCARAQTHAGVRILVSVDRSEDGTEAICREHAAQDARVEVVAQREQLGWSENFNYLLGRVETEFYFLYAHDDIIEPTYAERLRDALLERPEATSAHCDLERFGNRQEIVSGSDYRGSDGRRVLKYMLAPVRGSLIRSLTRTEVIGQGLRYPPIGEAGFWRCHPFLLEVVGSGAAVHVPEVLYRRWYREGSMTTTWNARSVEPLVEGQRESARLCLQTLDRLAADEAERELLRYGLYLFVMRAMRKNEIRLGGDRLVDPIEVSPVFADLDEPAALATQDSDVRAWVREHHDYLRARERKFLGRAQKHRRRVKA